MRTGRIKPGYGIIQRVVMQLKIDIYAKSVYCLLVSYAGENDTCFPSLSTMCKDLSISKPKLIDSLKILIKEGLIIADKRKTKNGDFASNIYHPLLVMEDNHDPSIDVVNEANQVVNTVNHGVVNEVNPKNNNIIKNNISLFNNKDCDLFFEFIETFNKIRKAKFKPLDKLRPVFAKRLKHYSKEDILHALTNAMGTQHHIDNKFNDLTPEFILREDKLEKYINYNSKKESQVKEAPTPAIIDHRNRPLKAR